MRIRWTQLAEHRTEQAFAYIAADRPAAAEHWLNRVLARVAALKNHPQSGRIVPEVDRDEIREVIVAPYRVVYRVDTTGIVVLTIRHARRLFDANEVRPDLY